MRRMLILSTLTLALGLGLTAEARADGVALAPSALDAKSRQSLADAIADAKTKRPAAFARVGSLRLKMAELDEKKRGRLASVSPILKAMGPDALMPMLEELAFEATPRGKLTDSAWLAWRVALLEAVGALRDPRSAPVADAILAGSPTDGLVMRAAAQALAKLNTVEAGNRLIALLQSADVDTRDAIVAGMGHCRRTVVAERLATELSQASGDEVTLLSRALGDVGNAWAWRTPFVQATGEEALVRGVAADALIEAFTQHHATPLLRQQLTQAILVVDHADTPALIAQARAGADAALDAALDELQARFDRSPLHR